MGERIVRSNDVQPLSKEDANLVAAHYLYLIGNQYELRMDEQEAKQLNISTQCYHAMLKEVAETNKFIRQTLERDPHADIALTDPQTMEEKISKDAIQKTPLIKSRAEQSSAPSGTLTMIGQETYQTPTFWLPTQYKSFDVYLRGAALTPTFTITTCFLADFPQIKIGAAGTWKGKVNIYASNVYGYIKCRTSDSNGATGSYTASTERIE